MRRRERTPDLLDETRHLGDGHSTRGDPLRQRPAAQQPEDQERTTRTAPVVVHRNDVRMLQAGNELGFGFEALHEARIVRELGPHHLDGHLASHARLHRPVHRAEAAFADDIAELVAGYGHARTRRQGRIAERDAMLEIGQRVGRRQAGFVGEVVVEPPVRARSASA